MIMSKRALALAVLAFGAVAAGHGGEIVGARAELNAEWHAALPMEFLAPSALTVAYSNVQTYAARALTQGPASTIGGNVIGRLMGDDITLAAGTSAERIGRLRWTTFNGNTTPVAARMRLRFWRNDGTTSLPGLYYATGVPAGPLGVTFDPVTLAANAATIWSWAPGNDPVFRQWLSANAGETIWIGLVFDNNAGGTGATEAQIANLGQLLFDPPAVGSTPNGVFITNNAGSFFQANHPAGGRVFFTGTNPPPTTNLGYSWETGMRIRVYGRVDVSPNAWNPDGRIVTIELRAAGTPPEAPPLESWTGPLANGGRFDFDCGPAITPGASYDIYAKEARHLKVVRETPVAIDLNGLGAEGTDANGVPLLVMRLGSNGDINGDNAVDLEDFLLLAATYEVDPLNPGYNAAADLDASGAVDLADFLILAGNYDQVGVGGRT
jgi:hypothetical protein